MSRRRPETWVRPARKLLPRYLGLRSFVSRRGIEAPAILVRWRPPGWWWFSKVVLGYAYAAVEIDGEAIQRPPDGLLGHKRNTDIIALSRGAEVRIQLKGIVPRVVYFDRVFTLADDEVLLLIAIDRFLRLPGNPTTIVEYSILQQ